MAHQREKHGDRCTISRFIKDVSTCPVCLNDFHSRVRERHADKIQNTHDIVQRRVLAL